MKGPVDPRAVLTTVMDSVIADNTAAFAPVSVPPSPPLLLRWASFSYDAAPAAVESFAIQQGGSDYYKLGIPLGSAITQHLSFRRGIPFSSGGTVTAILSAAGAGVTGSACMGYNRFGPGNEIELIAAGTLTTDLDVASGGPATVSLAAVAGETHAIDWIHLSYVAAPSSGSYVRVSGSSTGIIYEVDLSAAGPTVLEFFPPLVGARGEALTVTLTDGGEIKCLNVLHR